MHDIMEQLASTFFKDIERYTYDIETMSLCSSYEVDGTVIFTDVKVDDKYMEHLESRTNPDIPCVLNLIQIYVAIFKGSMKLAHEKASAFDLPCTPGAIFETAISWWSKGEYNILDIKGLDKEDYVATFAATEKKEKVKVFMETYNELQYCNSLTNPKGICMQDGVPRIPFNDVVLGQTLFAIKESARDT